MTASSSSSPRNSAPSLEWSTATIVARLKPERQVAAHAADFADVFDPVAVRLEVDVAEDTGLHALPAQLVEERYEGGLVVVPGGGARHERHAERGGLLLEQRERQTVAAADAAALVQHAHDGGRHGAAAHRTLQSEVCVLAAAPRDEDAGAGDRVRTGAGRAGTGAGKARPLGRG